MARAFKALWLLSLVLPAASGGVTAGLVGSVAAAPPPRYSVRFANGERFAGDDLIDWHRPDGVPKLNGKALLEPGNPLRWMVNRSLPLPSAPPQFIETFGGDRIPGTVTDHLQGDESFHEQLPAHFVMRRVSQEPSAAAGSGVPCRVATKWVRRIVWQAQATHRYQPRTVFLRDGGRLTYRVVRFSQRHVTLLLEDGTRKLPFGDIAELHFPARDAWELYLDELAVLAAVAPPAAAAPPAAPTATRLMQVETVQGLVATTSLARLRPRTTADPKLVDRWLHGIQPAWSLDIIWVPHGDIRVRRFYATNEVPLTKLLPVSEEHRSAAGSSPWPAQRNTNARGGPLRCRDGDFGWGWGVHANSELRFPLSPLVSAFRTGVGLDQVAGEGGCIRARIRHDPTGQPNHQSAFLTGGMATTEINWLPLQVPDDGQRHELVLEIDLAHAGRPAGSDPLDIRDITNWVDPLLQLDAGRLTVALDGRLTSEVPAWSDWHVAGASPTTLRRGPRFMEWADTNGRFGETMVAVEQPLVLSQHRLLSADDRWLVINATRSQNGEPAPRLQVRVRGELVADREFPLWDKSHEMMQPIVVSLADMASPEKQVEIELYQSPGAASIPIQWHAIRVSQQHPALIELFEDRLNLVAGDGHDPAALLDATAPHAGLQALRVSGENAVTLRLPAGVKIRERPQPGEYRFLRFAFRKQGGAVAADVHSPAPAARRYEAGPDAPPQPETIRVWAKQLPDQWIPITRDLFGDFREFDFQAITLSNQDGQTALFDHLYLARTQNDFQLAAPAPPPDEALRLARRELAKPVRARGLPAVVALTFPDGRHATGVIISAAGDVLTAGHHVIKPQQDVTVRLADQRLVQAKTLGVNRDLDLGLLKISDAAPFPFVDVHATDQFPPQPIYLGVAHASPEKEEVPPEAHLLGIRRVLGGEVWTDFELSPATTGGPLFSADGRLIAVHSRHSPLGGVCYSHFRDWPAVLARLKKGEAWGRWRPGTGPMLGVEITNTPQGCTVTEVLENSAAGRAGLQLGDRIHQLDGQDVVRLDQIYRRLATAQPGQNVSVGYRRGSTMGQARITLMPRTP